MRLSTEAPPQDPATDGNLALRQPVFGTAEPDQHEDRHEDRHREANGVDGPTAGPAQTEDQRYTGAPADQVAERAQTDEPAAAYADEPARYDEPADVRPGGAPATEVTAIWTEDSARDLRDRWREAQLRFVDDPQQAAEDIRNLVDEAAEALTAALASHREQLNSWPADGDTEQYRVIVQRYRTFFERLLTL